LKEKMIFDHKSSSEIELPMLSMHVDTKGLNVDTCIATGGEGTVYWYKGDALAQKVALKVPKQGFEGSLEQLCLCAL
jgi:hypothetical protein